MRRRDVLRALGVIRCGLAALTSVLAVAVSAPPASAGDGASCGGDVPCRVPLGEYRIAMPPTGRAVGALVFFHGYMASAEEEMKKRALVEAALSRRLGFVAPDGLAGTWSHDNAPSRARDETAFVRAVLDDLDHRFGLGPDRTIVGGFSQGASMAWYTVCHSGDRVAGAITFSGVFWNPLPAPSDCASPPPPMIHFHGTADRTFPLAGRAIGSRWHQGDARASLAVLRDRAGCEPAAPPPVTIAGLSCEAPRGCLRGPITACIHDRGHEVDPAWLAAGLDRLIQEIGLH